MLKLVLHTVNNWHVLISDLFILFVEAIDIYYHAGVWGIYFEVLRYSRKERNEKGKIKWEIILYYLFAFSRFIIICPRYNIVSFVFANSDVSYLIYGPRNDFTDYKTFQLKLLIYLIHEII